jgi:hypothetical protein
MAMTYSDSAALMTDMDFRNRIKVACLTFAKYILGEAVTEPAHNTRLRWAQNAIAQPDMTATQVQPSTVMQDQVQTDGKNVTDAALQTAVETAVGNLL